MSRTPQYEKLLVELNAGELPVIERKILEVPCQAPKGLTRRGLVRIVFGQEAHTNFGNDTKDRKIRKAIESLRNRGIPILSNSGKAGYELVPVIGHHEWVVDVFIHRISATDGLLPYSQVRIIDLISGQLLKARPHPCLWVSVDAPGSWFISELDRLVKRKIPIVILPSDKKPVSGWQFKPDLVVQQKSIVEVANILPPFDIEAYGLKTSTLRVLRILTRLKTAYTSEITSLVGFSKTYVHHVLKDLQARGLIEGKQIGKYKGWAILNNGLRLVQRSWNVPKGSRFSKYRTEYRYASERHRRKARMWRAWLETAYEDVKIRECWTEIPLHKRYSGYTGVGNLPRERNAFLVGGR